MSVAGTAEEMLPIFKTTFPEFNGTSDDRVLVFLNLARTIFYKCQDATLYLAAHLLVLANSNGIGDESATDQQIGGNQASLPLSMAKVGNKQAMFAQFTKNSNDTQYVTTNYGVIFLQLKNACLQYKFAAGVAGGC